MSDTKIQLELTGLERFNHLEDKIFRVVEAFKAIRRENESLRAEGQALKTEIESLRQAQAESAENVAQLQQEREHLRERVEKALGLLASLEVK
jgi:FtsZ-binding cell division protein ZapB